MAACAGIRAPAPQKEPLPDFDAMWDYGDPRATEGEFRKLLPTAESSGDRSYHAQLLTQIARTEGLQRRFEKAHRTLDAVEAMITDDLTAARIRYLLERGRVHNSSGAPEQSQPLFLQAWEIAREQGEDYYAVDAAHMLAIVVPALEQTEWNVKALQVAEESSDERARGWLGSLYNNMGWTYHELQEYERALDMFEKGLAWRQQREDEEGTRIAKWTIARTYRSLGRNVEALEIQRALEQELQQKDLAPDGYVYEEIAELLLIQEEHAAAAGYFGLAYEVLSQDAWLQANEPERLARLKQLAEGAEQVEE
jgi:tetratricopeptide (TPR) repeat protein